MMFVGVRGVPHETIVPSRRNAAAMPGVVPESLTDTATTLVAADGTLVRLLDPHAMMPPSDLTAKLQLNPASIATILVSGVGGGMRAPEASVQTNTVPSLRNAIT